MTDFYFNGNKVNSLLMVGYGVTGKSVCDFLANFTNLQVDISKDDKEFIRYDLDEYDLIAISPGIPINVSPYTKLLNYKARIVSDIDIFCKYNKNSTAKTIAITGSNGKSTVVMLLDFILNKLGYKSISIGNVGIPALDKVNQKFDYCVIEVSSFQIDLFNSVGFDIGCVINVSPDHLDRYKSFAHYKQAKLNLANFCTDFFVYDTNNSGLKYNSNYSIVDSSIYKDTTKLIDIAKTNLFGQHNLENLVVVFNILDKLKINLASSIRAITEFKGLDHRCKIVSEINGVTYINDSKGTNVGATIAALKSFSSKKNIILMLGGLAKGADFSLMIKSLSRYVKYMLIYGRDRNYIQNYIQGCCEYQLCDNLFQAFKLASLKAQSNEIVLLSPACASFDEFSNYVKRGETFENYVMQLEQRSRIKSVEN